MDRSSNSVQLRANNSWQLMAILSLLALSSATLAGYVWGWTSATAPPPPPPQAPVAAGTFDDDALSMLPPAKQRMLLRTQTEQAYLLTSSAAVPSQPRAQVSGLAVVKADRSWSGRQTLP